MQKNCTASTQDHLSARDRRAVPQGDWPCGFACVQSRRIFRRTKEIAYVGPGPIRQTRRPGGDRLLRALVSVPNHSVPARLPAFDSNWGPSDAGLARASSLISWRTIPARAGPGAAVSPPRCASAWASSSPRSSARSSPGALPWWWSGSPRDGCRRTRCRAGCGGPRPTPAHHAPNLGIRSSGGARRNRASRGPAGRRAVRSGGGHPPARRSGGHRAEPAPRLRHHRPRRQPCRTTRPSGQRRANFNFRAAFLEVGNDALGSLSVIAAAIVIAVTGWSRADAVAALVIGALILPRSLLLLRETIDVLLESTPRGLDLNSVRKHLLEQPHVRAVHDLHATQIATGLARAHRARRRR